MCQTAPSDRRQMTQFWSDVSFFLPQRNSNIPTNSNDPRHVSNSSVRRSADDVVLPSMQQNIPPKNVFWDLWRFFVVLFAENVDFTPSLSLSCFSMRIFWRKEYKICSALVESFYGCFAMNFSWNFWLFE